MKKILLALFIILISSNVFAVNLFNPKVSHPVIIVGDDAIESEKVAAKELAKYLNLITKSTYEIKNAPSDSDKVKIYVGQTKLVKEKLPSFDWNKLKYDGIIIETVGNDLILAGDRPRGTLYAVYTFLEDYLGCKFWTLDSEYIPSLRLINIKDINYTYTPKLFYRESHYKATYNKDDYSFAVKLKQNGLFQTTPPEWGDHEFFINGGHSFERTIPASYFKEHPDWFSLRDGVRVPNGAQLCLSNKEMRKEFIRRTLEQIAAQPQYKIIDVSQNDNQNYCQCEKCTELANRYGGQSGLLVDFLNEVSSAVKEKYPNEFVESFAYTYTRHAPTNIKINDNIIIRLCSIECDFSTPLDSETNKSFYKDIKDWGNLTNNIFVWNYQANFNNYHIPHPNIENISKNINLFVNNKVTGLFEQGDLYNSSVTFAELRNYVISKLIWNQALNQDKLIKDFINGFYGKEVYNDIANIIKIYDSACLREKYFLSCYEKDNSYFNENDYISAFKAFDSAISKTKDNKFKTRIDTQRKGLELSLMISKYKDSVLKKYPKAIKSPGTWCSDYVKWTKSTDNTYIREMGGISLQYFTEKGIYEPPIESYPKMCRDLNKNDWFDFQDGGFMLFGKNQWSFSIDDEKASDLSAAMEPCNHKEWAIAVSLQPLVDRGYKSADIYAVVRKENKENASFLAGVYDFDGIVKVPEFVCPMEDLSVEYNTFYIGNIDKIKTGLQVWVSPNDPFTKNSIIVDRIFAIKK